ncbi:hypothetical protein BN2537_17005 [Streptomyces venezuelae]|nr:hypothetical protein BN2537_17005 [Streptomyces venezuelae]
MVRITEAGGHGGYPRKDTDAWGDSTPRPGTRLDRLVAALA